MSEQDSQAATDSVFDKAAREAARKLAERWLSGRPASPALLINEEKMAWMLQQAIAELDLRDKREVEQAKRIAELEAYRHDIEANGGIPVAVQENAALNENNRALQRRVETLEAENAELRAAESDQAKRIAGLEKENSRLRQAILVGKPGTEVEAVSLREDLREDMQHRFCDQHATPEIGVRRCPECKITALRAERNQLLVEKADLRKQLDGYKTEISETEQSLVAAIGMEPEEDGRCQVGPHTSASLARDAGAMIDQLHKWVEEFREALEFLSTDVRRLQRIDIGHTTTYRVWGGHWPQSIIGKGPTPLAAIQSAMAKGCA